ncbi:MAG: Uma2 family endonuclease, partial [Chitinophagaceae bacterium]|nr:Uma2 family endonuclease [Anaerolineae bacterium]
MTIQERERLYTLDDLHEIEERPENHDKFFELIDGVIYEMAGTSAKPTVIAMKIGRLLGNYVDENNLGYITGADGKFEIGTHDGLIPDVAFVSKTRQPELPDGPFTIAPALAVEVVSPSDSIKATQRKAKRYLSLGTQIVWIVYPDDQSVDVCRLLPDGNMSIQEITGDAILDGGDALPGFQLSLAKVFL